MPWAVQIAHELERPGRYIWQLVLPGQILRHRACKRVEMRIPRQGWLAAQSVKPRVNSRREIERIQEFRQRDVGVRAGHDPLIGLCQGSGAHREHL